MSIDRNRLRYATEVFVSECRRQRAALLPHEDNPVRSLSEYSSEQQAALMRAVEKALVATKPAADTFFQEWLFKQQESQ